MDTPLPELLNGRRLLWIVAHHDDMELYSGGLLTLVPDAKKECVVMTAPAPNRPDTGTREGSFRQVCGLMGVDGWGYGLKDYSPSTPAHQIEWRDFGGVKPHGVPEFIISSGYAGEPNRVYPQGHVVHRLTGFFAKKLARELDVPLIEFSINSHFDWIVRYAVAAKKQLLDFYRANWDYTQYCLWNTVERFALWHHLL